MKIIAIKNQIVVHMDSMGMGGKMIIILFLSLKEFLHLDENLIFARIIWYRVFGVT